MGDRISPSRLDHLYHGKGMSLQAIGETIDVTGETIRRWMDDAGIDRRGRMDWRKNPGVALRVDSEGYERWKDPTGSVRVHQLLAIACGTDPHDVFGGGIIHHRNGIKWDNRPSNIELTNRSDHAKEHYERGDAGIVDYPGGVKR